MKENVYKTIELLKDYIESHKMLHKFSNMDEITAYERERDLIRDNVISNIVNINQCLTFMDRVIRGYYESVPNRGRNDLIRVELILLNAVEKMINDIREREDKELINYLETELDSRSEDLMKFMRRKSIV